MTYPLPTIYVDVREKERPNPNKPGETTGTNMLELIRRHRTSPIAEPRTLDGGDFFFSGEGPDQSTVLIGIERKRMRDMVNSVRGGRLSGEQLPKLMSYDYQYIIFESRWKTDWVTGQLMEKWGRTWEPVMSGTRQIMGGLEMTSFLNDIRDHTPIQIIQTEEERQTVEVILSLAHSWSRPWDKRHHHADIHRPDQYATVEKASTVRRVAYALKDVAWERSLTVEAHFPNVEGMIHRTSQCGSCEKTICDPVTAKDWGKLPGFGRVLSRKVFNQLHGIAEEG